MTKSHDQATTEQRGQLFATQNLHIAAWLTFKGYPVRDVMVEGRTAWIVFDNTDEIRAERMAFPHSDEARYMECYRAMQDLAFDAVGSARRAAPLKDDTT